MDATLTIRIRAEAARAQKAIADTAQELNALQRAALALNRQRGGFFDALSGNHLVKTGKNLQWLGRQLLYNITLPSVLAGKAMFDAFMGFEKSMTQLRKVYGDITEDQAMLNKETDALRHSFKTLSTYFGVHAEEVADVGAAWAAAGSAGRGLAENVKATLETMILGDMEAAQATEALIAIQATWRLSTMAAAGEVSELTMAMAQLNIIENQTGISFAGLVDVYERAGGSARTAGLRFEELGALAAALVPATGNATRAGNALRTILSRLASPTQDMVDALRLMNIEVTSDAWMGSSVIDKLRLVASEFENLSTANQNLVSSILGSRWQVNRLSVLLADLNSENGYYQKALDASSNKTEALATYQRELGEVLSSHPRRWEILKNAIRNAMMDAIIPLLPLIFGLIGAIAQLAQKFSELPQSTQKWILLGFAAAALIGPLLILISTFMQLAGIMGTIVFRALWRTAWIVSMLSRVVFGLSSVLIKVASVAWMILARTVTIAATIILRSVAFAIARMIGLFAYLRVASIFVRQVLVNFAFAIKTVFETAAIMLRSGMGLLRVAWLTLVTLAEVVTAAFVAMAAALGIPVWALVAIIAAVVAAIVILLNEDLRNGVWDGIKWVAEGLYKLPGVFVDVFNAILSFLGKAVMKVYDLLSYLNPFARHSPSLVDNVRAGVATILDEYAKLNKIGQLVGGAVTALESFGAANAGVVASRREAELREKANVPGVQGGNELVDSILALEGALPTLAREIDAQSLKVARLQAEYNAADAAVQAFESSLAGMESELDAVTARIDTANDKIAQLANTPIQGMGELEDQIFANELAQNKLRMELLEFEQAGVSIDSIRDKYAALNGDIEMLRAEQTNLRMAGAGSEILGTYDDQIRALQDQQGEMSAVEERINEIQQALDDLDIEKRFLDLTKAINFDPLERQIDKLVNDMAEMPFDEIVRQIGEQKAIIAELEPIQARLVDQVQRETVALEEAKKARDAIGASLDREKNILAELEDAYRDIEGLIRDMEASLTRVSDVNLTINAEGADKASRFLEDMFAAGIGEDFPIYGGDDILDREGTLADIEAFNKEMDDLLADALKDMGVGDMFGPLKEKWEGFKSWWRDNWKLLFEKPKEWFLVGMSKLWGAIQTTASMLWGYVMDWIVNPIKNFFVGLWNDVTGAFQTAFNKVVEFFTPFWEALKIVWDTVGQPVFDLILSALGLLKTAWELQWMLMKFAVETVWGLIEMIISTSWGFISAIFTEIWEALDGFLIPIFELFQVTALIVWELITLAVQASWAILGVIFGWIWDKLKWVGDKMWWLWTKIDEVWGLIKFGIVGAWIIIRDNVFNPILGWLEETIPDAFNALKDLIATVWQGIADVMKGIWDSTIKPIFTGIKAVFTSYVAPAFKFLYSNIIKPTMGAIASVIGTVWNAVAASIEGGVNFFVSAFNLLASGVNKIAGLLGIDKRVSEMEKLSLPRSSRGVDFGASDAWAAEIGFQAPSGGSGGPLLLASGGVVGRSGGSYAGARAIVGEGSNVYPEFVIPTDPRYRGNALNLWQQAGARIQSHMDGFGILGDVAGAAYGAAKSGLSAAGGVARKGAVMAIWNPIKWSVEKIINQMPSNFFKGATSGMLNIVDDWANGSSTAFDEYAQSLFSVPKEGAGSWKVITEMLGRAGIPHKVLSTFRPGAVTRNTGNVSWHALDRAIDLSGPSGMINYNPDDLLAINLAIYDVFKPYLKELIYGGPGAMNVFRGKDHNFSGALMREHVNHVHAAMARGGFVVPRTPGGSLFRIGEGTYDEKVQVIPLRGNESSGGNRYYFYGDLSFPNITDGNDAEEFLRNLESLGAN